MYLNVYKECSVRILLFPLHRLKHTKLLRKKFPNGRLDKIFSVSGCLAWLGLILWKLRLFCVQSSLNFASMSEKTNLSQWISFAIGTLTCQRETLRIKVNFGMYVTASLDLRFARNMWRDETFPLLKDGLRNSGQIVSDLTLKWQVDDGRKISTFTWNNPTHPTPQNV